MHESIGNDQRGEWNRECSKIDKFVYKRNRINQSTKRRLVSGSCYLQKDNIYFILSYPISIFPKFVLIILSEKKINLLGSNVNPQPITNIYEQKNA